MATTATKDSRDAELDALIRTIPPLDLPRPSYDGRSLPNIAVSVRRALGVEEPDDAGAPLVPPLEASLDPFGGRRAGGTVLVFLVDGFAWSDLSRWASRPSAEVPCAPVVHARPVTTVFPTTTTAALTSLSTGTAPAQHGIVGYRQYLPRFGAVVDLLKMSPAGSGQMDVLVGPAWRPEYVSGVPSLFRRGTPAVALSRDRFEGSGFTRVLYDGAEYVPYSTASDFAHRLAHLLNRERPPPLIYAYWDELDTSHHLQGPNLTTFDFEWSRILHLLRFVNDQVMAERRGRISVLVTGDHGQVATSPDRQVRVDAHADVVREMARPLAGDRRAGYFAARPGRLDALRSAVERMVPEGSRLVSMPDAVAAGLFGPPPYHPELLDRLGDLLVFVPPPAGLYYIVPGGTPGSRHLFGGHGGLAPEELVVPFVAGALAEFGAGG